MKIEIDIRGKINEWNSKSILGFASTEDNSFHHIVMLKSEYKKQLRKRFGKTPDFPEKLHCILIYFAIRDSLNKISSIQICPDIGKKKMLKYLKDYFKDLHSYDKIAVTVSKVGKNSKIHKLLKKVGYKKHNVDLNLTPSMIKKYFVG